MALHRLYASGRGGDVAVVVDDASGIPAVVHWGPDPGPLPDDTGSLLERPIPPGALEHSHHVALVPTGASGASVRPGLEVHGPDGPLWPTFGPCTVEVDRHGRRLQFRTRSDDVGLELTGTVELGDTLEVAVTLRNDGTDTVRLDRLGVTLPLPEGSDEILAFEGHWCRELVPRRRAWTSGTHVIDNRRGRTSHDHVPLVFSGAQGFAEHHGRVHGLHLAWSGNSEVRLERTTDGRRIVQLTELLVPGEVRLARGESYTTPTVHGVTAIGLTAASQGFHDSVRRDLPSRPRPVTLNTWEAVYFDHDLDTLRALAERAATVGVERFVLDDGWFGGRRDDTAGLGDWWVSPDAHPQGLGPLIDHVRGLGMEFGIWVEPEMVNPDSDLYRAHPEWVLGEPSVLGRNQLVLDLSIDACRSHLFEQLDALLSDHDIAYVKWDMNRDLAGAGSHHQTHALYRLLDDLGGAHPEVEIESCASGGGRADLAILRRTCRIWTSDCNDALERQIIQRGFSHLFPPAVMGAHVGPPRAHTTGRTQRLAFRAATAMFGHLGIEWNLLEASERHLEHLRWWIEQHTARRALLHGGNVVRLDAADDAGLAHGVVAPDRSQALFCHAQLTQSVHSTPPRLVLAGLDPDRTYEVRHLSCPGEVFGWAAPPAWVAAGAEASGQALQTLGLQLPLLHPESAFLIELTS